jgi:hypothetical protein
VHAGGAYLSRSFVRRRRAKGPTDRACDEVRYACCPGLGCGLSKHRSLPRRLMVSIATARSWLIFSPA